MTKQYIEMIEHVFVHGKDREERTGTGTKEVFGYQNRYDLTQGFPLLTTKYMEDLFPKIFHELMWFLKGETNIRYLVERNVNIWNADAYRWYLENELYRDVSPEPLSMKDFIECIKNDEDFAEVNGDLGRIYGKQWTDFGGHYNQFGYLDGINQIQQVIEEIKNNPNSRRLIVSAWNPYDMPEMALPPCHVLMQFYVHKGKLSCHLYQRSADLFLGVPFNIASYALLTHMIAHMTDLHVGEFIHTFGCLHIYNNHVEQMREQMKREPKNLPTLIVDPRKDIKNITEFELEDFHLSGYTAHGKLTGKVSVGL